MKIELKNIKFSESLSEETNAFTADLFINGKKTGYCKNSGQGGCTDYSWYNSNDKTIIADAEIYCKSLPKIKYGESEFDSNLESVIDQLFEDWLKQKEQAKLQKKMNKLMVTAILIGVPNGDRYSYFDLKKPLSTLDRTKLQSYVANLKFKHCTGGVTILNTNLESIGITI